MGSLRLNSSVSSPLSIPSIFGEALTCYSTKGKMGAGLSRTDFSRVSVTREDKSWLASKFNDLHG
jgi:hypothetical protein